MLNNIILRPALSKDINKIWDLLHAQSISWNEAQINAELEYLFVVLQDVEILGVLYYSNPKEIDVQWIAIHPLYPERALKDLVTEGFHNYCMLNRLNRSDKAVPFEKLSFGINML